MRRFSGFGFTRATLPVIRSEATPFPTSLPIPPATDPSLPAGFPEYTIRPEILGAPVHRGTVPGMYDQQSLISLFPSLTDAAALHDVPTVPTGAEPLPPPSPIIDIFNTKVAQKTDQAIEMDYAANLHREAADNLQRKADEAAYHADNAAAAATVDPTFTAQAEAVAASARADDAQYVANLAHEKANVVEQKADDKAVEAHVATQQFIDSTERVQAQYDNSVTHADAAALEQMLATPGMVPPQMLTEVAVPGFSVSPVVAAGVGGVIGFLLGGARGGAVGALLGGGATYFMGRQTTYAPVQMGPMSPSGWVPPSGGVLPVPTAWEFTPYQESDGTMIVNEEQQQAWYNAHYVR